MVSRTAYSTWTPQKLTLFDAHYLRNRSTLDIGLLGYIGIVQHKEHSPEVLSIPPGTPYIYILICISMMSTYHLGLHELTEKHPVLPQKCTLARKSQSTNFVDSVVSLVTSL